MLGRDGAIIANGKSLAIDFHGDLMVFDNPLVTEISVSFDSHSFCGFRGLRSQPRVSVEFYCDSYSHSNEREALKESAAKLSVGELLDVINSKLDLRSN